MDQAVSRRTFLAVGSRAAVAASVFAAARCTRPSHPSTSAAASLETLTAELERDVPQWMSEVRLPGLGITLIRDGAIAWEQSFGAADVESKTPVSATTVFEAASMSKPVFVYAVLQLHDQGVLDLDTPLTTYTKDRLFLGDSKLDRITARHVLSHTSGLPSWRSGTTPLAVAFEPGERWLYSGEAYYYLQSVVTDLTGRRNPRICQRYEAEVQVCATDIDAYLKARVLSPLGMASAGYVWTEALAAHTARPHDAAGRPMPKGHPTAPDAARYAAAGGLHCTVSDYARFLLEMIDPSDAGTHHLARESLEAMVRPIVKVSDAPFRSSWALGWQVLHTDIGNVIAHGGDNKGFHSFAAASRDRRSGFVVMTNGEGGTQVLAKIVAPAMLTRLVAG